MPFSSCLGMLAVAAETSFMIHVGDPVEIMETGEHLITDA
jgi:hypothetical protein